MNNQGWKPGLKIEQAKRSSICQLCEKKIGKKTHRATFFVESEWSNNTYPKHYHLSCMIHILNKSMEDYLVSTKDEKLTAMKRQIIKLREQYEKIKRFDEDVNV